MAGFVYLICNPDQNCYKIGVTRNLAQKRLKQLQTGNSSKLHIVYSVYSEYPFRLESMLHKTFDSKRSEGEWFNLDQNDVINFKDICNKKINIINIMKDNPFFNKDLK